MLVILLARAAGPGLSGSTLEEESGEVEGKAKGEKGGERWESDLLVLEY
jgi:hypothetical protein